MSTVTSSRAYAEFTLPKRRWMWRSRWQTPDVPADGLGGSTEVLGEGARSPGREKVPDSTPRRADVRSCGSVQAALTWARQASPLHPGEFRNQLGYGPHPAGRNQSPDLPPVLD